MNTTIYLLVKDIRWDLTQLSQEEIQELDDLPSQEVLPVCTFGPVSVTEQINILLQDMFGCLTESYTLEGYKSPTNS